MTGGGLLEPGPGVTGGDTLPDLTWPGLARASPFSHGMACVAERVMYGRSHRGMPMRTPVIGGSPVTERQAVVSTPSFCIIIFFLPRLIISPLALAEASFLRT